MLQERICHRYAKSIFGLAVEKGLIERIKEDFEAMQNLLEKNQEFRVFLRSPETSIQKKLLILSKIFKGKCHEFTVLFIESMTKRRREALLGGIITEFIRLYHLHRNETLVELISASPLSDAEKKAIKFKIEGQLQTTVLFQESLNPELIGGFELKIGAKLYDGSVQSALRKLKKQFIENIY